MLGMRVLTTIAVAVGLAVGAAGRVETRGEVPGQRLAMMRAEWQDKETWSHYNESQRENELGIGLQVPGPTGMTFVAFTGVLRLRSPSTPPAEIGVQVALGKFTNPTVIRRPSLVLVADAGTDRSFRLDLSSKLEVDDPAPGASVENGTALVNVIEFVRLVEARTIKGDVLGFEASFREDQLAAMRAFAERLHIKFTAPGSSGGIGEADVGGGEARQ